jgi:hypothetical protein
MSAHRSIGQALLVAVDRVVVEVSQAVNAEFGQLVDGVLNSFVHGARMMETNTIYAKVTQIDEMMASRHQKSLGFVILFIFFWFCC